jgi:UDP-N-acetylmuramate dehydrogenase
MVLKNVSLKRYNTFGLDYRADLILPIKSESETEEILREAGSGSKPLLILGEGSNILFTGDYKGTIIHPEISGINIEEKNSGDVIVSAGAGVKWDSFVEWSVNNGLGGVENLSFIPGSVGAAPVQNVGAYGIEAMDAIERIRTFSVSDGSVREFRKNECRFGYRTSLFKNELKGRYLITRVYFRLTTKPLPNLVYGSLSDEVAMLGEPTLLNIRNAVIKIRRSKLPDPEITGNAGSFFKNPVVDIASAEILRKRYPQMPCYNDPSGGIKLAAGWLIEQCGWKGKRIGNTGVHEKQALIIVNYGGASGNEIFNLSEEIKKSVWYKFDVNLEREVEVIGSI